MYNPDGQKEEEFAWGLGNDTDNEAKAIAILQGLTILRDKVVRKATTIGDLMVIL